MRIEVIGYVAKTLISVALGLALILGRASATDKPGLKSEAICQAEKRPGKFTGCPDVNNILPDADTALTVGKAILETRFGTAFVKRYEPYVAEQSTFYEDAWCVLHALPSIDGDRPTGGGHPEVCLSKKNGRVVQIGIAR